MYLPCMANNNIQIYSIYNHISLINLCLNYNYSNEFNSKDQTGPNLNNLDDKTKKTRYFLYFIKNAIRIFESSNNIKFDQIYTKH